MMKRSLLDRVRGMGRALLHLLIKLWYPAAPSPAPVIATGALRRVLVIRIDPRVGNVLLTTPLLRALRQGLPKEARLDLLVAEGKEALVAGLAARIIPFQKRDLFRAPWCFLRAVRALRRERYDLVIEAGHWHTFSFTSAWLARATRAPVRLGHARGLSRHFLTHLVERNPAHERDVTVKLELLEPLGLCARGEELETTVDLAPESAAAITSALGGLGLSGERFAAMNPGARKVDYRWAPDSFGALARRLFEQHRLRSVILWGPGEEELARRVVESSNGAALLAPPTNLAELAALFRRAAVVVTNDTGPMHLAVATGAPVVAVLVQADGARWSHGAANFRGVSLSGTGGDGVERVAETIAPFLAVPSLGYSAPDSKAAHFDRTRSA